MDDKPESRLDFIQALRGIAALAVVLWHASRYLGPYGTGVGELLFYPGMTMGVDLFFIISGLIMFETTVRSDGSLRYTTAFFIKRITRIWPVYFVATMVFVYCVRNADIDYQRLIWGLLFLPYGGADSIPPTFGAPELGVGWTLNYEIYFYLIFGLSMLFGRARWVAFAIWIFLTVIIVRLISAPTMPLALNFSPSYDVVNTSIPYFKLATSPIVLSFAAGVAIGYIRRSAFTIRNDAVMKALLLLSIGGVVLQYAGHYSLDYGPLGWGHSLIPCVLMFCLASKTLTLTVPYPLVYLGNISYSLYLLHPTALGAVDHLRDRLNPPWLDHGVVAFVCATFLSLVIAEISYRYIERGLCEFLRSALLGLLHPSRGAPAKVAS